MAIGRAKKPVSAEDKRRGPLVSAMRANLKYARHYRQCLLRDLDKVAKEWALICTYPKAHYKQKLLGLIRDHDVPSSRKFREFD